jgi:hypothetical protein
VGCADAGTLVGPARPGGRVVRCLSLHRGPPAPWPPHTCRQTATSRPCTLTCSAGNTIGA